MIKRSWHTIVLIILVVSPSFTFGYHEQHHRLFIVKEPVKKKRIRSHPIRIRSSQTRASGSYFIGVQLKSNANVTTIDATIDWTNADGNYIAASDHPLLHLTGLQVLFYSTSLIVWIALLTQSQRHQTTRLQLLITICLLTGWISWSSWLCLVWRLQLTGSLSRFSLLASEFVSCLHRSLMRLLVLVICLGYGVNKARLGRSRLKRLLFLASLFFTLVTVEGFMRQSTPRSRHWSLRDLVGSTNQRRSIFLLAFPLVQLGLGLVDLVIGWLAFVWLAKTLRETRLRPVNNLKVKYRLYQTFASLLALAGAVFTCIKTSEVSLNPSSPINTQQQDWSFTWASLCFWPLFGSMLLCVILCLWRPDVAVTGTSKRLGVDDDQHEQTLSDSSSCLIGNSDTHEEVVNDANLFEPTSFNGLDRDGDVGCSNFDNTGSKSSWHSTKSNNKRQVTPRSSLFEMVGIEASSGPNDPAPTLKID